MDWTHPGIIGSLMAVDLVGVTVVGTWFGRRGARSEDGFMVAGRTLGTIPVSFSMISQIIAGGSFLGTVGLFSTLGIRYFGFMLSYAIFAPVLFWFVGRRLLLIAHARGYATLQDLYGDFYRSRYLRAAGALVGLAFLIPYFAANGVALGLILEKTTGLPFSVGVCCMVLGTILYSVRGGTASVAYTDVVQGALVFVLAVVMLVTMLAITGGPLHLAADTAPLSSYGVTDHNVLLLFYGWLLFIGLSPVCMPDRATRTMSARSVGQLRRSTLVLAVLVGIICLVYLILGLAARSLIGPTVAPDASLLTAFTDHAPALVPLLIVVVWTTGMGNLDSGLVAATTMFHRDLVGRRMRPRHNQDPKATERRVVQICRALMLVLAGLAIALAVVRPPAIWTLIGAAVSIFTQYVPMTVAALYWRRVTRPAAEISWTFGVAGTLLLYLTVDLPNGLFPGMIMLGPNALLLVGLSLATSRLPAAHVEAFHRVYQQPDVPAPDHGRAASGSPPSSPVIRPRPL